MNPQSPVKSPIANRSAFRNPQSAMSPIFPGSTIGVLGGGQLGRMFAMAARRLGYRVHTLAPEHDTPTGQIADVEVVAPYDDVEAVRALGKGVDVVTFEVENVSAAAAAAASAVSGRTSARSRTRIIATSSTCRCRRPTCHRRQPRSPSMSRAA